MQRVPKDLHAFREDLLISLNAIRFIYGMCIIYIHVYIRWVYRKYVYI